MKGFVRSVSLSVGILGAVPGGPSLAAGDPGTATVALPAETSQLKPGPGVDVARQNCLTCHSVDYIYMQPPLTEDQWRAEVVKMKKAMGAPIADGDVDVIVKYLMSQNGKK
jgi:mono/diheme cytochrome c family protein